MVWFGLFGFGWGLGLDLDCLGLFGFWFVWVLVCLGTLVLGKWVVLSHLNRVNSSFFLSKLSFPHMSSGVFLLLFFLSVLLRKIVDFLAWDSCSLLPPP